MKKFTILVVTAIIFTSCASAIKTTKRPKHHGSVAACYKFKAGY